MWVLRLGEDDHKGDIKLFFGPFDNEAQARRYLMLCSADYGEISEVIPASCPDCMGPKPDGCEALLKRIKSELGGFTLQGR